MRKLSFLNLTISSILVGVLLSSGGFNKKVLADDVQYEQVNSPQLVCKDSIIFIESEDKVVEANATQYDKGISISFKMNQDDLRDDEKSFAVFEDCGTGKVVGNQPLIKSPDEYDQFIYYDCHQQMPYHTDMVKVSVYKQKKSDPDFTVKEENLLREFNLLMAHESIFYRPNGLVENITMYDEDGGYAPVLEYPFFLSRITPNYYSLSSPFQNKKDYITILLPNGREYMVDPNEKCREARHHFLNYSTPTTERNAAERGNYFNFYIPNDINEFTVKYHSVSETGEVNNVYKMYIRLNRA